MTAITATGVDGLRSRMGAAFSRRLDAHIERLDWDAAQLRGFQREELRTLLSRAPEHSPFSLPPSRDRPLRVRARAAH
jgi:hypothetical protein